MTTTLICDRMWGRRTGNWFCSAFPHMKGQTLVFRSDAAVDFSNRVEMLDWLMTNGYV